MKIHIFRYLTAMILVIAGLAGCGGGGGGGSAGTTNVTGTASKGIMYPGTINVYALDAAGNKGVLLAGPISTNINGKYNASLPGYSGAIVVEASGTYTDEATGTSMTIPASAPLHAMADNVNWITANNRVVSVTPLTEIAWRKAHASGTKPTATAIVTANKLVGDLFKVTDILGTEPVRPDPADMAGATQNAQAYTLTLATISSMASTASGTTSADRLETVIARMEVEVEGAETSGSMSSLASSDFTTAMGTVSLCTDFPSARDQLTSMGSKSQTISLATSGTLPAGTKIYAIQGSITLPANVSVRTESTVDNVHWKVSSSVFALGGVAIGMGPDPVANYLKLQQQVDFSVQLDPGKGGIGIGDFAVLTYDVAMGTIVTAANFSIPAGSFTAKDANGADITGVTLVIK